MQSAVQIWVAAGFTMWTRSKMYVSRTITRMWLPSEPGVMQPRARAGILHTITSQRAKRHQGPQPMCPVATEISVRFWEVSGLKGGQINRNICTIQTYRRLACMRRPYRHCTYQSRCYVCVSRRSRSRRDVVLLWVRSSTVEGLDSGRKYQWSVDERCHSHREVGMLHWAHEMFAVCCHCLMCSAHLSHTSSDDHLLLHQKQ